MNTGGAHGHCFALLIFTATQGGSSWHYCLPFGSSLPGLAAFVKVGR